MSNCTCYKALGPHCCPEHRPATAVIPPTAQSDRVTDLLNANNAELDRRRALKAELAATRVLLGAAGRELDQAKADAESNWNMRQISVATCERLEKQLAETKAQADITRKQAMEAIEEAAITKFQRGIVMAERDALAAQVEQIRAALEPFAAFAREFAGPSWLPDACPVLGPDMPPGKKPTVGDLRRAAEVLRAAEHVRGGE